MPDYDYAGNDDPENIIANTLDNGEQAKRVMRALSDLGFVILPKEPTEAMTNTKDYTCGNWSRRNWEAILRSAGIDS